MPLLAMCLIDTAPLHDHGKVLFMPLWQTSDRDARLRLADRLSLLLLSGICRPLRKSGPMQQCTGQGRLSCLPLWYSWDWLGLGVELPSGGGISSSSSSSRCASVYFFGCPVTLDVGIPGSPAELAFIAEGLCFAVLVLHELGSPCACMHNAHRSACHWIARL